ncbi:MAG TPA: protein kinase [Povalibacter sp.]|uniref:serine/threonine-protein kinase n=1 Tax=Povalibacter sp. TaxID=1962978 RepID=UPI002B67BF1E|nr:protein kinase [Povalibacter sp.]HMN43921.1 protein kinase [Povalibacter sp.]
MDKSAALARLGLTGSEDAAGVTRAYGQRLSTIQEKLVGAQTDTERLQHQTALSAIVEAYEFLTESGRYTRVPVDDSSATMMRDDSAPSPAVHSTLVRMDTGAVLSGRLEIGERLGQGGMGYVYAARDRLRSEDVAIKVLRQDLSFSTAAKERFLAEAKVSSNLSHPNIVRVYDVGEAGGHYYLSMERLKGQTLRQRIEDYNQARREFSVAEVTDIARQLIDALRYAHRYIVHRDLKPENIWLSEDGTLKLMDFGIARAYSNSQLTQTGMTLGTAYYMAPEQRLDAKEVDWRADLYALGVVMYELLTGTIPMGAVKPLEKVRRDVPLRYAQAVMRAMSPRPDDRWTSLDAFLSELQAPKSSGSKAAVWIVLGLGFVAAAAAGGYYMTREQPTVVATVAPPASTGTAVPVDTSGTQPPQQPPAEIASTQIASTQGPPAQAAETTAPVQAQPEPVATPVVAEQTPVAAAPVRVAKVDNSAQIRRQECLAQCERSDGECRSINRRGKQDCMRAVGFGATGGFTASPGANAASADCSFYGQARCEYARDRSACLARISARYNACVNVLSGNVASRRQDCDNNAREADRMCLDEMRECKSYCE